jgi:hypothetical protein
VIARPLLVVALLAGCADATSQLEDLAHEGAACSDASDCCVVVDDCAARAYVVGSENYGHARDLATEAEENDLCAGCEPPFVEVSCVSGSCAGVASHPDRLNVQTDHCGPVELASPPGAAARVIVDCSRE